MAPEDGDVMIETHWLWLPGLAGASAQPPRRDPFSESAYPSPARGKNARYWYTPCTSGMISPVGKGRRTEPLDSSVLPIVTAVRSRPSWRRP